MQNEDAPAPEDQAEETAITITGPQTAAPVLKTDADVGRFVEEKLGEWKAYQELTRKLLDDSDYQKIGKTRFKKKSAWRKYARAFNITCQQISSEIVRDDSGYPVFARFVVRASTPDGRMQDADQECHLKERCCPAADTLPCSKDNWSSHRCCTSGCNGRVHFSHPGDLPATAFTRAKNRAISDLIGAGEVSAEEMRRDGVEDEPDATATARKPARRTAVAANGGDNSDGKARHELKAALVEQFKGDEQAMYDFVNKEFPAAVADSGVYVLFTKIPAEDCERMIAVLKAGT